MSKEEKLSKRKALNTIDEMRDKLREHACYMNNEMIDGIKSLIESSAQEPETAIRITFDSEGNIIGIPYRSQSDEEFRMRIDSEGKVHLKHKGEFLGDAEEFYKKHGDEYDKRTMKLVKIIGTWTPMDDVRFALLKSFIRSLVEKPVVADWIQGEPYEALIREPSGEKIEEKAREFVAGFLKKGRRLGDINYTEDFIRNLYQEAPVRRPSRAGIKEFTEKWAGKLWQLFNSILNDFVIEDKQKCVEGRIAQMLEEIPTQKPSEKELGELAEKWATEIRPEYGCPHKVLIVRRIFEEYNFLLERRR